MNGLSSTSIPFSNKTMLDHVRRLLCACEKKIHLDFVKIFPRTQYFGHSKNFILVPFDRMKKIYIFKAITTNLHHSLPMFLSVVTIN